MAIPTAPPHRLKISVSTTLCALALLAAPAGARAAAPADESPRAPFVLAQAAAQPSAARGKASAQSSEDAAITATVRAWAQAWAGQDVDRYLGFYAPTFKPEDGMTRKAWESQRRSRVKSPRSIVVTVDDVEVTRPDATHATVKFRQTYQSDRYHDQVGKTLDLVHEGDRWLIVKEEAGAVVPKKAAAVAPEKKAPAAPLAPSLGELRVLSNLGQRFYAEIELGALQHLRKDDLTVRLAPADAYQKAGITFNPVLVGAQTTVEERDGRPFAVLTTRERVQEPFLDLLVEVESKTGRLVRKYTALLDPPTYIPPPPAGAVMGPTPTAAETARAAPPAPKPAAPVAAPRAPKAAAPVSPQRTPKAAAPVSPPPAPAPTATAPPAVAAEYRVRPGDTLARIAGKHVQQGVTLEQMLVALYRANPEAFINGNINLLSAGSVLKIPDRATATALEPAAAEQTARALMSGAKEHGGVIAAKAPTVAPPEAKPAGRPKGAAPAAPKSEVKLSRAEPGKPVTPSAAAASGDDRAARERALKEAMSRVEELEKTVADLQKLIQIRNEQIADLEQRIAAAKATAAAAPPKPAAEAPKPTAAPPKPAAEAPKPAAAPPKPAAEAPKPAVEAPKPATETPKPAPVAPKPAPEAPKPAAEAPKPVPTPPKPAPTPPKPRPAVQPAPEPSLFDEYLGDPYMVGGLAGVFVLLIAYGVYAWRRKKRALRSRLSESLLGAAGAAPALQTVAAMAQGAATAPGSGEDADPLEEADVYMTYGRDAQAEEILREAIQKGETRPLAYSMLLQIYAKRRDIEKFESTALKMRGLVGGEGADWDKAMALGRSIDPGNSLYGQGDATAIAPAAEAAEEHEVDFDLDAISGGPAAEGAETEARTAPPVDFAIDTTTTGAETEKPSEVDMTIDFDLGGVTTELPAQTGAGAPAAPSETAETAPGSDAIDFDLGGVTAEMPAQSGAAARAEAKPAQAGGIPPLELSLESESAPGGGTGAAADFDLSLEPDSGQAPQPAAPSPAAAPPAGAPDLSGISLDLSVTDSGGGGGGADARLQEVATKLHLAKSFEEIGDHDAARELLEEVIKEGDSAQQAQAQKMLASLG